VPTGTPGDDTFTASSGNETFDGGAGVDTVSYASSGTGVNVDLASGQSTPFLVVMPFGDSITYGVISSNKVKNEQSGGYRIGLWNSLQADGLAIDYVGSLKSGPTSFPDRDNEGLRGDTIEQLNALDAGYLSTYKPDVVLLMIGTNDTVDDNAATMISELHDLIVSIAAADPKATIFVAGIPPIYDSARNAIAQQYNAMIPGLVDQLNDTLKVVYVDTSDLTLSDVTPPPGDWGVHPTAGGYVKLAADWYNAIADSGVFGNERDTLTSIENVTGSAFADRLTGDSGNNVLSGLAGDDQLVGGGGKDTLDGGTGIDRMTGGTGDDTYVVDSSSDVVVENAGEGIDTIQTATKTTYSLANLANVENLTFTGTAAAKLTGNAADNRIEGGAGNDVIDGAAGADTLVGNAGSDTFIVDNVGDTIVEGASGGSDTVKASVSFTLGANVEKLTLTGTVDIDGTGNELNNTITGNAGANNVYGFAGVDTLYGLGGNDHLYGGDGSDVLRGGTGADVLEGGAGGDRFDWDSAADVGLGAGRDQVVDFTQGNDRMDFVSIDANSNTSADNAFAFIGANAFSGTAGQLRAEVVHGPTGDYTLVQGDLNGDRVADFEVALLGFTGTLKSSDFLL
jgi:Ca2+-binding RTX toxin-like protein